ncbi:HAD family hydrolase [Lacipirellula limnantheis]|uniref:Beta-phosphoglucomutase n=1 Tax=Lacipirellula limnantheis TaxID=2528024 RepID=A0A517TRV5_9BACT|nr:HAD family phosphatase [Lacipirellula limnantheis]QDT71099.1 Beta-phosphoglucomutase [Lacipirellula limnantheis]
MPTQLAVIFDVDGVLTDSYLPHYKSWERMFAEIGVAFSDEQFRSTFGRTNRDIFAQLYPGEQMTAARAQELGDKKEYFYREIISENFTPLPGAVELIDALAAAGFKLAVGSSGPPENVRLTLEKLGRAERFDAMVTGADVTHGKPNPEVFLKAAEWLGVPPAQCAVIEDAPQGIEAANAAGMTSIAVLGTTTREKLSHATFVAEGHHELSPARIAELIERGATR